MVEAVNKHADPRFVDLGSFRDQTIVRVTVTDTDEPPVFQPAEGAIMEVQEDARLGALVGIVTAMDPDMENAPIRYERRCSGPTEADKRCRSLYSTARSLQGVGCLQGQC